MVVERSLEESLIRFRIERPQEILRDLSISDALCQNRGTPSNEVDPNHQLLLRAYLYNLILPLLQTKIFRIDSDSSPV